MCTKIDTPVNLQDSAMANIRPARLLASILIAFFILDCFPVISASVPLGQERIGSSWFCGGKSRKLYSDCWKTVKYFKGPGAASVSLRQVAGTPPPPQHSQPPPRK
ncbi:hypothetical protein Pfo_009351 [Paulownia fortunei]|nr:hypothetical protein Pfo_009351 [Paulownia fortunei]